MPTLTDWLSSDTYARRQFQQQHARQTARDHLAAQATQAQTIVAHEGWQLFLNLLEERVAQRRRTYDALLAQITQGDHLGDALSHLKLQLTRVGAEIQGLTIAADLIPTLLQRASVAQETQP